MLRNPAHLRIFQGFKTKLEAYGQLKNSGTKLYINNMIRKTSEAI